jgi:hypothetical protein
MGTTVSALALLLLALCTGVCAAEPIRLHPDNPHYFLFRAKPTVLITSAEHYGAVVNRDFDYVAYLDALKRYGLNATRIYPGFLIEPVDKWLPGNSLGPRPEARIMPWARSDVPGAAMGGRRFDLDRWDADFFARLRDFIAKAGDRGIVVEICLFNAQYADTWPIAPLYHENNIQGVGDCDFKDAQTLKHADLVRREEDYVRKVVQEVNSFDNVVLEICDEPFITGTPIGEAGAWVGHMLDVVAAAERELPNKHLVAQQVEGPLGGPCDFSADPRVSVIVAQYVWVADGEQLGGMQALDRKYGHDKPIELNETCIYPVWYHGDTVGASRVEAWEFIVGGGASFNQLNQLYTVANPAGDTPDNARICQSLGNLRDFIYSFDFLKMRPDRGSIVSGVPAGAYCRMISEPGRQYALYLHHSAGGEGPVYEVTPGDYRETLVLDLPAGNYRAEWLDPASGVVLGADRFDHAGGSRALATPSHSVDLALRIKAAETVRQ